MSERAAQKPAGGCRSQRHLEETSIIKRITCNSSRANEYQLEAARDTEQKAPEVRADEVRYRGRELPWGLVGQTAGTLRAAPNDRTERHRTETRLRGARPGTEIRLGVFFLLGVREPIASHPRSLCERGPPEENGSISGVQTMYPAFDAWVLYR
jgi:hypothetical protein